MPGDPTGGRLRLKAFCPVGKPNNSISSMGRCCQRESKVGVVMYKRLYKHRRST